MTHEVRTELNCPDGWPRSSFFIEFLDSSVIETDETAVQGPSSA